MRTAEARAVLPRDVSRAVALHQAAQVAAMVAAFALDDYESARPIGGRPHRRAGAGWCSCPGFAEAKAAALAAGALGSSISGSGPTVFALARGRESAERVARAMAEAYRAGGAGGSVRVSPVDRDGARVDPRGAGRDEVPDRATGELAALRLLRQRADRDRSPPALPPLRRPARDRAPSARPDRTRAAVAVHGATRQGSRRTALGGLAIPRDRPSVGGAGRLPPRGEHAAHPPRRRWTAGAAPKGCCSSTRVTTRPARSRTGA